MTTPSENEIALDEFVRLSSDGSISGLDFDSALDLADRASESPDIVAKAFGRKGKVDATRDDIRSRMMDLYSGFEARKSMADRMSAKKAEEDIRKANTARCLFRGLTRSEVARVEFDAANGDKAPLMQLKSKFVFG